MARTISRAGTSASARSTSISAAQLRTGSLAASVFDWFNAIEAQNRSKAFSVISFFIIHAKAVIMTCEGWHGKAAV
jgi:hypothetical protein